MATSDIKVKITLDGTQQFQKDLRSIGNAANTVKKDFAELGSAFADTAKKIALVGAAIAAAATGLVTLAAANGEAAEKLQNLSKITGTSVEDLQTLQKVAETNGVSQETLAAGLKKLTRNMQDFRDPTSAAAKELGELDEGLLKSLKSADSTEQAFTIARNALAGIEDETKRANIAQALFGKSGIELIPILTQTNAEFEAQQKRLKDLGVILNKTQVEDLAGMDNAFDEVKLAVEGLGKSISAKLAPALTKAAQAITEFFIRNQDRITKFVTFLATKGIDAVTNFFKALTLNPQLLDKLANTLYELSQNILGFFGQVSDIFFKLVKPAFEALITVLDRVAASIGFGGGGAQLGLTFAILQFFGVFRLGFLTIKTFLDLFTLGITVFTAFGHVMAWVVAGLIRFIFYLKSGTVVAAFNKAVVILQATMLGLYRGLLLVRTGFIVMWASALGPVLLVIAAIALVGFALFKIIDLTIGWPKAIEIAKNAWDSLMNLIVTRVENVKAAFAAIGDIFDTLKQRAEDAFFNMVNRIRTETIPNIKAFFGEGTTFVASLFIKWAELLVTPFKPAIEELKKMFANLWDFAFNPLGTLIEKFKKDFRDLKNLADNLFGKSKEKEQFGPQRQFLPVPRFAQGGFVSGSGTSLSDSIPAWLSNGEFVIRARAVQKYGTGLLSAINNGALGLQGYAQGGLVEALSGFSSPALSSGLVPAMAGGIGSSGRPLNLVMPDGQKIRTRVDESTARRLEKDLRKSDIAKTGQLPRWYK